jgi:hypothetical protein
MLRRLHGPFGPRGVRGTRCCRPSYRPTVEMLEERALPTGTAFAAGPLVKQINAAADHLLQMTPHLAPPIQGLCGTDQFFVLQLMNLLGQVQTGASAAKARFAHGGQGGKNPATVLRQEKRLIADLRGYAATGGVPGLPFLTRLATDACALQRPAVLPFPLSLTNPCDRAALAASLSGGGSVQF